MGCSPAPALVIEAAEGVKRGWLSSGIVGNTLHKYGFHVCYPAAGDYSLEGQLNKRICECACAYDMQTRNAGSRLYVASVFERIREGEIESTTAEFIGSPNGTDVYYWNWKQGRTIQRYRGAGHDLWCHRACFRSAATKQLGWLAKYDASGHFTGGSDMPLTQADANLVKTTVLEALQGASVRQAIDVPIAGIKGGTIVRPLSWWLSWGPSHIAELERVLGERDAQDILRDEANTAAVAGLTEAINALIGQLGSGGGGSITPADVERIVSVRLDSAMPAIEAKAAARVEQIGQFLIGLDEETPAAGSVVEPT